MIPNQWYIVMDTDQVKTKPVGVTRMGEKLVFWRDESGKVSCLRDRCVHRGVKLSKGKVIEGKLQCPFHGFEYDLNGIITRIPAIGKNASVPTAFRVHSYPAHEEHGFIWIWWGENPPEKLQPPRFFPDLDDGFSYGRIYDPWNTHYSRAIENQLDVVHLPFIHHNTIGRGNRTLIDGPVVRWDGDDAFYLYVYNRVDDGTPPRKPREMPDPNTARDFRLGFIFPNLWQNYISPDSRVVAAFVPVDEENTILYLRFYQKFIRIPLLRELVNWLSMPFNRLIAHQDRRVVETHQPPRSDLKIGEKLISGDHPIIEYRRRRAELIEKAKSDKSVQIHVQKEELK
ncbi:MAG: aromatic ring-hydroxylating dioxygenase subunit alpha [Anaerolineales bacterium]|nr:aromatic ring-hydroxylating dioxygenase subunit alpha [Anaerolineales bacterium]